MADEYIRKQDAIRLAEQGQVQGFPWQFQMLVRLPPADVVQVCHCKDCENWQTDWNSTTFPDRHYCAVMDHMMKADDFCSYGEREEREHGSGIKM